MKKTPAKLSEAGAAWAESEASAGCACATDTNASAARSRTSVTDRSRRRRCIGSPSLARRGGQFLEERGGAVGGRRVAALLRAVGSVLRQTFRRWRLVK